MSENLKITKEQLVNLLKEAHKAYQGEAKPPASTDDAWVDWYADHIIKQLNQPDMPQTKQLHYPPSNITSSKITEPKPDETSVADSKTETDINALQVCPTCAHRNRPGVLFCENCGTNLLTGSQVAAETRDLRESDQKVAAASSVDEALSKADKPQANQITTDKLEEKPAAPQPAKPIKSGTVQIGAEEVQAVSTAGSSTFLSDMILRIEVEGGATPIVIKPKAEDMILGRRDPTTGASPEVDLTSYAGYRMGVSRRHASLALENNRLNLWDLGSSNGTFINGTRLTPHQPSPLRDGDEVRLGQMVLRLFFQKNAKNNGESG